MDRHLNLQNSDEFLWDEHLVLWFISPVKLGAETPREQTLHGSEGPRVHEQLQSSLRQDSAQRMSTRATSSSTLRRGRAQHSTRKLSNPLAPGSGPAAPAQLQAQVDLAANLASQQSRFSSNRDSCTYHCIY